MSKKPIVNPNYCYTEGNIDTYVNNVIKYQLGGFIEDAASYNQSVFLLQRKLGNSNDFYHILYSGAIDHAQKGTPLDFFLDKSKQPAPSPGKRDDRKDVFEELMPVMLLEENSKAKILFPYNITNTHWLTGEIIIEKNLDIISIKIYMHDPYGGGEISDDQFLVLHTALQKRIQESGLNIVSITKEPSSFSNGRQNKSDGTSCGVIVADEIVKRIKNDSLNISSSYSVGVEELRLSQLSFLKENLGDNDPVYQIFAQQVTEIATVTSKQQSAFTKKMIMPDIKEEIVQKYYVKEFLSKLFGISISNEMFVNISLIDLEGNKQITVNRSNVIDNALEQMLDITPLLFIKKAIEAKAIGRLIGLSYTMDNFIKYILSISSQIQGRCLTDEQYDFVKGTLPDNEQKEFFDLKIITTKKDNSESIQYLITDKVIINQLENQEVSNHIDLSKYDVDTTTTDYGDQIQRYTKYMLSGLRKIILDSHYTLETTCKLIAQFILSIFNKEEETYFSTKDNLLFKEIHFYKYAKEAKKASNAYEIVSYKEVVDKIVGKEKYFGDSKSPYIRVVDNKEIIITSSVEALNIIDLLTKNIFLNLINDNISELVKKYNKNYNFSIDTFTYDDDHLDNYDDYNNTLNADNFDKIIYHHAAKHLYFTFDFRSLGNVKILALKHKGDGTRVVKVYTDAVEIEQYSIQQQPDIKPEKLISQIIAHISILLSPFASLRSHVLLKDDSSQQKLSPIKKIFNAFCELLKADYNSPDVLGTQWFTKLEKQFDKEVIDNLNKSGLSDFLCKYDFSICPIL